MKIRVEVERCIACGQCVMLAPTVFDQDDGGMVVLLKNEVIDDQELVAVDKAFQACPSAAIAAEPS